jgi:hypothetical protein
MHTRTQQTSSLIYFMSVSKQALMFGNPNKKREINLKQASIHSNFCRKKRLQHSHADTQILSFKFVAHTVWPRSLMDKEMAQKLCHFCRSMIEPPSAHFPFLPFFLNFLSFVTFKRSFILL